MGERIVSSSVWSSAARTPTPAASHKSGRPDRASSSMRVAIFRTAASGMPSGQAMRDGLRCNSSHPAVPKASSFRQSTRSSRAASSPFSAANREPGPHKTRLRRFLL